MSETFIVTVLGIVGAIITNFISYALGQRAERQRQSLLIRVEMLKPIDEWLKGAEKIVTIFSHTAVAIAQELREPIGYDLSERKIAFNFISEKTNEVLGIIESDSLNTRKSKKIAKELGEKVIELNNLINFMLLPKEIELVERSNKGTLTKVDLFEAGQLKLHLDSLLRKAYSLVAQIKTALT